MDHIIERILCRVNRPEDERKEQTSALIKNARDLFAALCEQIDNLYVTVQGEGVELRGSLKYPHMPYRDSRVLLEVRPPGRDTGGVVIKHYCPLEGEWMYTLALGTVDLRVHLERHIGDAILCNKKQLE
jgi:hypothetical protein